MKHGNGTEKYCNGDYYIGHFREGEFDGTGKYIWSNGSTYSGQFKKGKKHGRGKWIVKDKVIDENTNEFILRSSIYTGCFEDDYKQGFGTIIWSTGGRYDGQFRKN